MGYALPGGALYVRELHAPGTRGFREGLAMIPSGPHVPRHAGPRRRDGTGTGPVPGSGEKAGNGNYEKFRQSVSDEHNTFVERQQYME